LSGRHLGSVFEFVPEQLFRLFEQFHVLFAQRQRLLLRRRVLLRGRSRRFGVSQRFGELFRGRLAARGLLSHITAKVLQKNINNNLREATEEDVEKAQQSTNAGF
jgi:hypothetical protein